MYFQYVIEGLTLGFATGISCAVFCIPVFIGLASRNLNNITPITDLIFFLSGRLLAYSFIAILFSGLGAQLGFISIFDVLSKAFIAILLILWGVKGFKESDKDASTCPAKKFIKTVPFVAGILTGLSPCPPFIAGITRVFVIGDMLAGLLYFLGFYITTSLFLIPALATGLLKYRKELKVVASFVSIIFGIFFILQIRI